MRKNFSVIRTVEDCFFYRGRPWRAEFRPLLEMPADLFELHLESGYFVRGIDFYKPVCSTCSDCIPIRVPVARFQPSKSQRQLRRKRADLEVRINKPFFSEEKLAMYSRYHQLRWGWSSSSLAALRPHFEEHLLMDWGGALEFSYWQKDQLVGYGVVDETPSACNSRYFVYDPEVGSKLGLGVLSLLCELDWAKTQGKEHCYLGMYVASSTRMAYKIDFRPFQLRLPDGEWREFAGPDELSQNPL
jgi:arginyl-tRNA--protein-N-Asp/Glu arginylyltransferase